MVFVCDLSAAILYQECVKNAGDFNNRLSFGYDNLGHVEVDDR